MKKLNINYVVLFLVSVFTFLSCEKDSDSLTGNEETGGNIIFQKENLSYVVGNGKTTEYPVSMSINQTNKDKVQSIDVYKTFYTKDAKGNVLVSNKVLLKTLTVNVPSTEQKVDVVYGVTFNDLYKDLKIGSNLLSNNDGDLQIGDYWSLTFVSNLTSGIKHEVARKVKLSVGTRFAGIYKCIDATYYRIGVLTGSTSSWPAKTVIESVNATTYKVNDYLGLFSGNTWYFIIDSNDKIKIPPFAPDGVTPNIGNGLQLISCDTNANDLTRSNCGTSNIVVRDNVKGKDQLKMTFGYIGGGGSREFYQVLEKIVE